MSNTRLVIEQEAVKILAQLDDQASMVPVPFYGTIASDGTTITSPQLDHGTIQANRYDGRIIKVAEDATALAYAPAVTVTGVHTAATTALTVSSTTDIRVGHILEIGTTLEKVLVRAVVSATVLTVTRGYQGTTATATSGAETVRYDPFGFYTGIDDGGFAAGGILTISPNFPADTTETTGGPYAAGSFIMYPKGLVPDYLIDKMNAVLRNTDHPYIWFPSLVPDSDFVSNDITNWAAVLTPTTRAFSTDTDTMLFGERSLNLATDAASEGAHSLPFDAHAGEQLLLSACLNGITTSFAAQLYNNTAGTVIKTVTETAQGFVEIRFRETVPSGCVRARVRFLAPTATVSGALISPPVIVQSNYRTTYNTPSWFTREGQVMDVLAFRQGYASTVSDSFVSLSAEAQTLSGLQFYRADRDLNPLKVQFCNYGNDPIAIQVMRPFGTLGYDTATTNADLDYVANRTVANILLERGDSRWLVYARKAASRARALGYGGRAIRSDDLRVAV